MYPKIKEYIEQDIETLINKLNEEIEEVLHEYFSLKKNKDAETARDFVSELYDVIQISHTISYKKNITIEKTNPDTILDLEQLMEGFIRIFGSITYYTRKRIWSLDLKMELNRLVESASKLITALCGDYELCKADCYTKHICKIKKRNVTVL